MKVAVMGVLERQVKMAGHFPDLDLRCIPNKRTGDGLKYMDGVNGCDHILVNTKFISHQAVSTIDKSKAIFIHGGVGAVRSELKRLNYLARVEKANKSKPMITIAPAVPSPPTPEPATMTPPDNESSRAQLYGGEVGDLFTFTKPTHLSDNVWRTRLASVRFYAKHHKGRDTEIDYAGKQARIMITKLVLPDKGPKAGKPYKTKPHKTNKQRREENAALEAQAQETRIQEPFSKLPMAIVDHASGIWREAYLKHGIGAADIAADAYLKWYRKNAN